MPRILAFCSQILLLCDILVIFDDPVAMPRHASQLLNR